jgi:hypothetical protein
MHLDEKMCWEQDSVLARLTLERASEGSVRHSEASAGLAAGEPCHSDFKHQTRTRITSTTKLEFVLGAAVL